LAANSSGVAPEYIVSGGIVMIPSGMKVMRTLPMRSSLVAAARAGMDCAPVLVFDERAVAATWTTSPLEPVT
jgi:hypothetical protein